jgi:hypothetical protein
MPGTAPPGKLFFLIFSRFRRGKSALLESGGRHIFGSPTEKLIVRIIVRLKLRRRSEHLVAPDQSASVSARSGFIVVRIGRDDSGAA